MASIKDIMNFFEMGVSEFGKEWKKLTLEDKEQIRSGFENESLTY